ncbi:tetratricopeptide repeat protein [Alkalihalobacillus sp. FSL R5-0424]
MDDGYKLYQQLQNEVTGLHSFISFDRNHYMREFCSKPERLLSVIQIGEDCLRQLHSDDRSDRVQDTVYGILGNLYRMNNQPVEAIEYLERCVMKAVHKKDLKREAISSIRLAEALKYAERHHDSLEKLSRAEEICRAHSFENILDFVLQHKGKCFAEMGRMSEARASLDEALEIRIRKKDPSLIESTKLARECLLGV